tara:strand:+ start:11 stop:1933 length:1923 start_codon:yes stop_codon:yes gene_type:complete
MAINFLNTVDLNKNSLDRAVIQNLTADPATGNVGQIYYNTVNSTLRVCVTADTAAPTNAVWSSISGDITEVQESLVNGLLGINVLNPTGPIPVVGLDIAGLTALGTGVALTDSLAVYDLDTTTNKSITVADIVGKSTWLIEGNGANPQTIVNGDTVDIVGSTYITSVASTTGANNFAVTLTHDATTRNDTTSAVSANVFSVVNSVTTNSTGHVTAVDVKTVTTSDTLYVLDKAAGSTNLILSANGVTQDTIQFTQKNSTSVTVTGAAEDVYEFGLADDVILTTSLVVNSGGAATRSSFGYQVTIPETPLVDSDAASKKYVDDLVAGGLTFLGTFRADTGEILSGTNSGLYLYQVPGGAGTRVAVVVGDYYVVATAGGDFYANTSYPLDVGDSIIGVSAAAADASVVTDWSLVSQGVTVNSFTNANGTYISSSVPANTNATGAVTIGTLDLSAIDGTSDVNTKFLSKDNTWDVPSYTTNTDAKYALTAEPKSGTSVPLTLTGSNGGSTTIVDLTEGANITLTRTSATEITIASTDTGALGKNILLNTSDAWVSSSAAGGITTFAVDVSNANVFNSAVGAVNVKCEVIDASTSGASAGQTVYADITRGVDAGGATFGLQSLNISFTGTPASSAYRVLLTYIG